MEYNELITKARQVPVDAPDADAILDGMHRTLRHRRLQRQALLSLALVLVVATSVYMLQPQYETRLTLAERVSRRIDTPPTNTPAPLVGYRHSISNRNIYTLL